MLGITITALIGLVLTVGAAAAAYDAGESHGRKTATKGFTEEFNITPAQLAHVPSSAWTSGRRVTQHRSESAAGPGESTRARQWRSPAR